MAIDPHPARDRPATVILRTETYGGLLPDDLSRTIIAYGSGNHNTQGWPLGYTIWAPAKRRIGWVKEAFGGTQDASELARGRRRFLKQLEQLVAIDWQLPRQDFHRSIEAAIDQHFPELSPGARLVLLTRFDHLRCEPMAVAIGRAISDRLARRALIPWA